MSMSTAQLNTPEPFDFAIPKSWIKWRRRFERYRQESNLIEQSGEMHVSKLIYSIGDQSKDILVAFGLTEDEQRITAWVWQNLTVILLKNQTSYTRVVQSTNTSGRKSGRQFHYFAIYGLVKHCKYGSL